MKKFKENRLHKKEEILKFNRKFKNILNLKDIEQNKHLPKLSYNKKVKSYVLTKGKSGLRITNKYLLNCDLNDLKDLYETIT